ncbi:MAG TPA: hypothetical protein VGN26_06630 [Armatimonadota bacterium]|jgi:hypothetical protein
MASRTARPITRNIFAPLLSRKVTGGGLQPAWVPPGLFAKGGLPPASAATTGSAEATFGDWAWTGTATVGRDCYAVLQNLKTSAGQLLKQGDTLDGGTLQSVSSTALLIRTASKVVSVSMARGDALPQQEAAKGAKAEAKAPQGPGPVAASPAPPAAAPMSPKPVMPAPMEMKVLPGGATLTDLSADFSSKGMRFR